MEPDSIISISRWIVLFLNIAAAAWLGMRICLHVFGTLTEGTVMESLVQSSGTSRMKTYSLKIQYAGPDGKKRMVKGSRYSSNSEVSTSLQVGKKVPVYYLASFPSFAIHYDPVWHYIAPTATLVFAFMLSFSVS